MRRDPPKPGQSPALQQQEKHAALKDGVYKDKRKSKAPPSPNEDGAPEEKIQEKRKAFFRG
jgi:hypothetical protein